MSLDRASDKSLSVVMQTRTGSEVRASTNDNGGEPFWRYLFAHRECDVTTGKRSSPAAVRRFGRIHQVLTSVAMVSASMAAAIGSTRALIITPICVAARISALASRS